MTSEPVRDADRYGGPIVPRRTARILPVARPGEGAAPEVLAATCRIQAMTAGRAQVGFVEVPIPAQSERRTAHTVTISTQGDAVSAAILGCETS